MPRATPTEDLELIESIVTAHADGIRIVDLEAELSQRRGTALNRRAQEEALVLLQNNGALPLKKGAKIDCALWSAMPWPLSMTINVALPRLAVV